jgi:uncharacterized GH25 family protein
VTAASILTLHILDVNGAPVADAKVSTTTQPSGVKPLTATTNQTGYATFNKTKAGYYSFSISKEGYNSLSQSVNYTGKPITLTMTKTPADNTMLIVAPVAAVILIIAIAVTVIKRRRRSSRSDLEPLTWPMPQ